MSEIQATINRYLRASAGTANMPTDHTFLCFIGMLETGEATMADFEKVGGKWLVNELSKHKERIDDESK